jgi:hypothetical protein
LAIPNLPAIRQDRKSVTNDDAQAGMQIQKRPGLAAPNSGEDNGVT